ncbi:MAG TPA: hypothetical protein VG917_04455 [Patescibacteria group bacterium]|nr:hypothetical protein [Patescibacteria group bacterium]
MATEDKTPKDPIGKLISEHTEYSKNKDELLDIHVGNPLKRITELLEEIKKQKAFSFTLKGSLGIAGVFLALSIFGILGGGAILCDKGNQSQVGIVKVLNVKDTDNASDLPVISLWINYFAPKHTYNRTVLVKQNGDIIRLPYSNKVDFSNYSNYQVLATGSYDSCSQSLTINDPSGIEVYLNSPKN